MRKPRFKKVGFNTKLIVDVTLAALIVQQAPKLLGSIIGADETMQTAAGVGAGYLAGMFLNKPDLANASIAIGAVSFLSPLVDDLLGGTTSVTPAAKYTGTTPIFDPKKLPPVTIKPGVSDYLTLNDYVSLSASQTNDMYRNSY